MIVQRTVPGRLLRSAGALALAAVMVALACDLQAPTSVRTAPPAEQAPEAGQVTPAAPAAAAGTEQADPAPGDGITVLREDGTTSAGFAIGLRHADGSTELALFRGPRPLAEVLTGGSYELDAADPHVRVLRLGPEDRVVPGQAQQTTVSGQAGSVRREGPNVTIRGINNLNVSVGAQPIVFIDGVRIMSSPGSQGSLLSPLDQINPDDIDRIEIMSGPAASTLYGDEAAAGVIQVFTTRSRAEPRPEPR